MNILPVVPVGAVGRERALTPALSQRERAL
jgi:hypothetical protein